MYVWKCWRDTRWRCLIYSALLMIFLAATLPALPPDRPSAAAAFAFVAIVFFGLLIGIVAAVSLGSVSIGEEWDRGSLEFLLTRPYPRWRFLWTAWAVGAGELLTLATLPILLSTVVEYYWFGDVHAWRLLKVTPLLFGTASTVYGTTFLFSMLLRSGRKGMNAAFGSIAATVLALLGYGGGSRSMVLYAVDIVSASPKLLMWLPVLLVFPIAAQLLLERAEI